MIISSILIDIWFDRHTYQPIFVIWPWWLLLKCTNQLMKKPNTLKTTNSTFFRICTKQNNKVIIEISKFLSIFYFVVIILSTNKHSHNRIFACPASFLFTFTIFFVISLSLSVCGNNLINNIYFYVNKWEKCDNHRSWKWNNSTTQKSSRHSVYHHHRYTSFRFFHPPNRNILFQYCLYLFWCSNIVCRIIIYIWINNNFFLVFPVNLCCHFRQIIFSPDQTYIQFHRFFCRCFLHINLMMMVCFRNKKKSVPFSHEHKPEQNPGKK